MIHGSAWDRGMADSYYQRPRYAHKIVDGLQVPVERGSIEFADYMDGYDRNEAMQNFKDFGDPEACYNDVDDYEN
jgi:hypothetical protein